MTEYAVVLLGSSGKECLAYITVRRISNIGTPHVFSVDAHLYTCSVLPPTLIVLLLLALVSKFVISLVSWDALGIIPPSLYSYHKNNLSSFYKEERRNIMETNILQTLS